MVREGHLFGHLTLLDDGERRVDFGEELELLGAVSEPIGSGGNSWTVVTQPL